MRRLAIMAALALAACAEPDRQAPPAPVLALARTPTSLGSVRLRGSAEIGAVITVLRDPRFAPGEEPVQPASDPYIGTFALEVPLAPGAVNHFVITARDAAGNVSPPASVTIEQRPPAPVALELSLPEGPVVDPHQGTLRIRAELTMDQGLPAAGQAVRFSAVDATDARTEIVAAADARGSVEVTFSGLARPGAGLVAAESGAVSDEAAFVVGGPERLALELADRGIVDATQGELRARAELSMSEDVSAAGWRVRFTVEGHPPAGGDAISEVWIVTDARGRADLVLPGMTRTGVGRLVATVEGIDAVTGAAAFEVVGGAVARATLTLVADGTTAESAALAVPAGAGVTARLHLEDTRGNARTQPWRIATDAPGAAIAGSRLSRLFRAGEFVVVGTVIGESVPVSASASLTILPGPVADASMAVPRSAAAGRTFAVRPSLQDAHGNDVRVATMDLSVSDARSDEILGPVTTLFQAGARTLFAAVTPDGASDPIQLSAAVDVIAGPPARIALGLTGTDVDAASAGLQVAPPLANIGTAVLVEDAFGNALPAPARLSTDAPGTVAGRSLRGVTRAGRYQVVATATGSTLSAAQAFEVLAGPIDHVSLVAPSGTLVSGGTMQLRAEAVDAFGNRRPDTIAWTVAPPGKILLDATGLLDAAEIVPEGNTDTYTVQATAAGAAPAMVLLTVLPGEPASLALSLEEPAAVSPGGSIPYGYEVRDAQNNQLDVPVALFTDAPGAIMAGGSISNLTVARAASYLAIAQVVGLPIGSVQTFSVTTSLEQATVVRLDLAASSVPQHTALPYTVQVTDGHGNAIDPGVELELTTFPGASVVDAAGRTIIFAEPGEYQVSARVPLTGATDSERVFVVRPLDTTVPSIAVEAPAQGATFMPGATLTARVSARDDVTLRMIQLQLRGVLQHQERALLATDAHTETFTVSIPRTARYGEIQLGALAVDSAGNAGITPEVRVRVTPPMAAGFLATTVALGRSSGLFAPQGLAQDGGAIYVANAGDSSLLRVDTATGEVLLLDTGLPSQPRDVALRVAAGRLYLSLQSPDVFTQGRVDSYDLAGNFLATLADPFEPVVVRSYRGLAWLETSGLFAADANNDRVRRYSAADPPAFGADLPVAGSPWGVAARALSATTYGVFTSHTAPDEIRWAVHDNTSDLATSITVLAGAAEGISDPRDVAIVPGAGGSGRIVVANRGAGQILRIDVASRLVTLIADRLPGPVGLEFIDATHLLVTDELRNEVLEIEGPF